MNRREIMCSAFAGASFAAGFAAGTQIVGTVDDTKHGEALSPALAAAIVTHRRAFEAAEAAHEAFDRCCVAHADDLQRNPIRYLSSVGPMQFGAEGHRCPDRLGNVTPAVFQDARRQRALQGYTSRSEALIEADAFYTSDLEAMWEAAEEEDRRWVAARGVELEGASDDAGEAERQAWPAFRDAPAVTPADVEAKIRYVLASPMLTFRATGGGGEEGAAFLRSLVGGRVA